MFNVAQIVKLLLSPRERVRWKQKSHSKVRGKIYRKATSWAVDGEWV